MTITNFFLLSVFIAADPFPHRYPSRDLALVWYISTSTIYIPVSLPTRPPIPNKTSKIFKNMKLQLIFSIYILLKL
jgi:hypothetical protein